jgi:hypothetical protein
MKSCHSVGSDYEIEECILETGLRNTNNGQAMPCCVGLYGHCLHTDNYVKANCFQHALVCRDSRLDLVSQVIHFQFVSLKSLDTDWTCHLSDLSLPGIFKQTKCLGAVMLHDRTKSALYLTKLRPFTCGFIYCLNVYKFESIRILYFVDCASRRNSG